MDKYGIENVRGGSWVTLVLDESTIKHLKISSAATNDRCLGCDKTGHFIKNCPNKNNILQQIPIVVQEFKNGCKRCGRDGHKKKHCYAKKDINKNIIKNNDYLRCGRRCKTGSCKKTHDILGELIRDNDCSDMTKNDKEILNTFHNNTNDNSEKEKSTTINLLNHVNIVNDVKKDIINDSCNDNPNNDMIINLDTLNQSKYIELDQLGLPVNEIIMGSLEQLNNSSDINDNNRCCKIIWIVLTIIFIIGCSLIGKKL